MQRNLLRGCVFVTLVGNCTRWEDYSAVVDGRFTHAHKLSTCFFLFVYMTKI